jgi:beta-lactam-binding protein with PASTA domain
VIGQDPPPNATDASAPRISLLVAQDAAPEGYIMPSFIGQPIGSVTNTLRDAGLSVGKVTMAQAVVPSQPDNTALPATSPPGTVQPGSAAPISMSPPGSSPAFSPVASNTPTSASIVVSQDPTPGQKILAGSAINFVVR